MFALRQSTLLVALAVILGAVEHAAGSATTQIKRRSISKVAYGEAVVIVNARGDGVIEVGAADATHSLAFTLVARDAGRWVDSSAKIIRYRARSRNRETTYRAFIEERGVGGAGISLARRVIKGTSQYSVFFADTSFGGFSIPLTEREATVFVGIMRRAVVAVRELEKS